MGGPSRTPSAQHPIVVSVHPEVPELLIEVAAEWARRFGAPLCMAYVDESRVTLEDHEDGTVEHTPLIPDEERTPWRVRDERLRAGLASVMSQFPDVAWTFRYRAGLLDRELAHLAHDLDAAAFISGTRAPGLRWATKEWFDGPLTLQLARRQRRPVILVPLGPEDWQRPVRVRDRAAAGSEETGDAEDADQPRGGQEYGREQGPGNADRPADPGA